MPILTLGAVFVACSGTPSNEVADTTSTDLNFLPPIHRPPWPPIPIHIACGGIDEATCSGDTCESGLQPVNGKCTEPTPDLELATINVTGPLTLQGAAPWSNCTYSSQYLGSGARPCPDYWRIDQGFSAHHWVDGSGFSMTDAASGQGVPKTYVPDPSVTIETTVSFTDDTSAMALPAEGTTCMLPGFIEGNHAHYTVTVQHWVDNASSCPAPAPSSDPDYSAPPNNAPSPTGQVGCWLDLASNQTDLYGASYGAPSAVVAPQDGSVSAKLAIPVNLSSVSNYLRLVVSVWEGDTREGLLVGRTSGHPSDACAGCGAAPNSFTGWSATSAWTSGVVCSGTDTNPVYESYQFDVTHPVSNSSLSYTRALSPFQLVVLPVAFAQLKVWPYALIYQPPGNASKASYQTTSSFGVSVAFTDSLANNSTNTVDTSNAVENSLGISASGNLPDGWGKLALGATLNDSTKWDHGTKTGVGTISSVATNQATTYQTIMSETVSNAGLTPGANETYAQEPLWGDTFVLLVHPQVGLWNFGSGPVVSLLAAEGTPTSPIFMTPITSTLDACAYGLTPYANGYPIPGTDDVLSSAECAELLQLDPFYRNGQGTDLSQDPRFVHVTGIPFGMVPGTTEDQNPAFTDIITYTTASTVQLGTSYNATITDVLTTSSKFGQSLGVFGITASDSFTDTETATTNAKWQVELQTSYTATAQSSLTVTGNLDDHHTSLPYQPYVDVYRDLVFGTFAYVDSSAPPGTIYTNFCWPPPPPGKECALPPQPQPGPNGVP